MKRGIVNLTDPEANLIRSLFADTKSPLINKLNAAIQDADSNSEVELSEQELESILDSLSVPGESNMEDRLRYKLGQAFRRIAEVTEPTAE